MGLYPPGNRLASDCEDVLQSTQTDPFWIGSQDEGFVFFWRSFGLQNPIDATVFAVVLLVAETIGAIIELRSPTILLLPQL